MNDPKHPCVCDVREIQSYERRVSGPLLDRIDMVIDVPNVETKELAKEATAEASTVVRKRVVVARSYLRPRELSPPATTLLEQAFSNGLISTRGYFRIQTVAQTIAALANSDVVEEEHIAEAIQYRVKGK